MVLPTDRQTGDIIDPEDINDIAEAVNLLEASGGGGGTTNHSLLTNRDAADQHPISAITGLQTALNAKADSTAVVDLLAGKADSSHNHSASNITSGTLAVARLPTSSTSASGIVELATNTEAQTGTDTARAVTPAALRAAGDQRYVRTVNGTGPDGSGNVDVSGGGGGAPAPGGFVPAVGSWLGPYAVNNNSMVVVPTVGTDVTPTLIYVAKQITCDGFSIQVDTADAGVTAKMILYGPDANGLPDDPVFISAPVDCSSTGLKIVSISALTLPAGTYFGTLIVNASGVVKARMLSQVVFANIARAQEGPSNITAPPVGPRFKVGGTFESPTGPVHVVGDYGQNGNTRPFIALRRSA